MTEEPKVWTHHVRIHPTYTTTVADMLQMMLEANQWHEGHPDATVTIDDAGMLIVYHSHEKEAMIP